MNYDDPQLYINLAVLIASITMLISTARTVFKYLQWKKIVYKTLEITPPAFEDKTAMATEALSSALHQLGIQRTLKERLTGIRPVTKLEIRSSKSTGIEYYLTVDEDRYSAARKLLQSYIPNAKIKDVDKSNEYVGRLFDFKQSKSFAYPIRTFEELYSHDPINYITAAMTKLEDSESVVYSLLLRPRRFRAAEAMRRKILKNESFLPESKSNSVASKAAGMSSKLLFTFADAFSMSYNPAPNNAAMSSAQRELEYKKQLARGDRPVRTLSYFEHELVEGVSQKLQKPLFQSSIVVQVKAEKKRTSEIQKSISSALGLFNVEKYQSLKIRKLRFKFQQKIARFKQEHHLVGSQPNVLSSTEVASLFHFPNTEAGRTENVVQSLSKTLPAPVSLKNGKKFDTIIGKNIHQDSETIIGLSEAERERHMYVLGGTGNGKTTMLKYQIVQDMITGKGVAVVDPHGDLAEELLGYVPKDRMNDVIYINPDDLSFPVGINLLELTPGLSGDELLREKDIVTESTVSVLRKIFSEDDSGGHRIEYVLRNTIQTALTMEDCNMFSIFRLLNDKKYRRNVVNNLENEDLKIFWKNEIGKAGEMQKIKMAAGITSKIGRFLFSASAKRIMEQSKSTIDFDTALDEKKIIICNFSKGLLGEDTSMLFGVTVLAKLQLASLRRARRSESLRTPYYLYVDEFQNFATMSFVQMLSEARKYKLFLTMAEQSTQQQADQRLVDIILANVGTIVAFRSGSPVDERLILPLFKPFLHEGEISNLPAYNYYARITSLETQEPMSGQTLLIGRESDENVRQQVIQLSRENYGLKQEEVRAEEVKTETTAKPASKSSKKKSSKLSEIKQVIN